MKIALASAALVIVAAVPAFGAGSSTVIGDPGGDANFLNDGGEFHTGNQPTPGSDPSLDLREVRFTPLRAANGTTTGFVVTVTTEAPLRDRAQITVYSQTRSCGAVQIKYVDGARSTRLRYDGSGGRPRPPAALLTTGCSSGGVLLETARDGRRLTVTVPLYALPSKARADNVLQRINAYSQVHVVNEPLNHRPTGTSMIDTTIAASSYTLR